MRRRLAASAAAAAIASLMLAVGASWGAQTEAAGLRSGFVDPAAVADPDYNGTATDDPLSDAGVAAAYKAASPGVYSFEDMGKLGLPVRDLPAMLGLPACPTKDALPDTAVAKARAAADLAWCAFAPADLLYWVNMPPSIPPQASERLGLEDAKSPTRGVAHAGGNNGYHHIGFYPDPAGNPPRYSALNCAVRGINPSIHDPGPGQGFYNHYYNRCGLNPAPGGNSAGYTEVGVFESSYSNHGSPDPDGSPFYIATTYNAQGVHHNQAPASGPRPSVGVWRRVVVRQINEANAGVEALVCMTAGTTCSGGWGTIDTNPVTDCRVNSAAVCYADAVTELFSDEAGYDHPIMNGDSEMTDISAGQGAPPNWNTQLWSVTSNVKFPANTAGPPAFGYQAYACAKSNWFKITKANGGWGC